ncbi:hypothetical protein [Labrys sp. 22185]|uniref:hypothetical protein n=1 Tax=Labrys sp. 22185 TaxID=3453888 RepID=UPI003F84647E
MRSFLSSALLATLVAGCAAPQSTVIVKPFTGHVPRIPGNYEAAARLPEPPRPEPAPPSSSSSSFNQTGNSVDENYCAGVVTPTHSSYRWCNKHGYPTKDRR